MFDLEKPNILVLDIDLTLGCFDILYSIFTHLPHEPFVEKKICKQILEPLLPILERTEVFRPGLRKFLRYVKRLKQTNALDAVILFTNQVQPSSADKWWPITPFLTACFQTLSECSEPLFDRIYRRSYTVQRTDPPNPKDIRRILEDIGLDIDQVNILFVDDYPEGIILSGDKPLSPGIAYKIQPYHKRFETQDEVMPILLEVFESLPVSCSTFIDAVWATYKIRRTSKRTLGNTELEYLSYKLLDICVAKDQAKELTWKPSTEISATYEQFWDKWLEADDGASEGGSVSIEATGGDGDRTPRSWLSELEEGDRLMDS